MIQPKKKIHYVEVSLVLLEWKREHLSTCFETHLSCKMELLGGFWGLRIKKLIQHITKQEFKWWKGEVWVTLFTKQHWFAITATDECYWTEPCLFLFFIWYTFEHSSMHSEKEVCLFFPFYILWFPCTLWSRCLLICLTMWLLHACLCVARYLKLLFLSLLQIFNNWCSET